MAQGQNRNVLQPGQMQNSGAASASNVASNMVNRLSRDALSQLRHKMLKTIYCCLQKRLPSKTDDASKQKLFKMASLLENEFFRTAKSKEDYWDVRTIEVRIDSTMTHLSQRCTNPSSSVNATVQRPGALHGWGYTATPMLSTSNSSHNIPDATIETRRLLPTNRINRGSINNGYQQISPVSQMIPTPAVDNSANADIYQSHRIEENSRDGGRLMAAGSDFGSPSQLQRQCRASSNDLMLYNLDHQLGGGYISNIHQNTAGINSGVGMSSSNLHLANGPRSSEEVLSSTYFSTLYQPLQRPVNQLVSPMNRNSMCNSGTVSSADLYRGLISPGSMETSVDMNSMSQNPMRGVDASFPSNQSSLQAVEKTPKSQLFRQFENGNFQSSSGSKETFAQVSHQPLEHQFKQQAHHGQSRQQEHLLNNDTYLQSQPISNLVIQVKHQPHVEYYNEAVQMKVEPSNSQNHYMQNTFKNVYVGAESPSVCSELKNPPSLPSQPHQSQQISQLTDLINLSAGVQPVSGLGQWHFSSQNLAQISKNCNGGREQFGVRFPMKHEGTSNSSSVREPTNCKIVASRSTLEAPHHTEGSNTLSKQLNGDCGPSFINQRRWLLFLLHVRKCNAAKGNCESKYCFDGKMLLKHVDSCKSPACTYKYCLQTRKLIHHNKHCGNEACLVCVFVKNWKEKQKEKISLQRTKSTSATLNHGHKEFLEPMRASGESVSEAPFAVDDLQHPSKRVEAEIPFQFAFPGTQSIPATIAAGVSKPHFPMGLQEKNSLQRDVCETVRSDVPMNDVSLQRTKPNSAALNHGHQESLECMRASSERVSEAPFVVDGLQPPLKRLKVEKPSQFAFPGTQSIPATIAAGVSRAHIPMGLQEKDSLQRDVCKTVRSDVPMNADVSLQRTKPNSTTLNHGHQESLECMRASSESVSGAPFAVDGLQPPLKRLKVGKPSQFIFPGTQSIPATIAAGVSKAHFSMGLQEKDSLQRDVCKTVRSDVPMNADSSDSSRRIVPVSNKEKSVCKDTPMGIHGGESAVDGETVSLPEQEKLKCMNEISSPKEENAEQSVGIVAASNRGHSKIEGVSLIEVFTPEQVEEHIHGLRQWVGQSKTKAEKNKALGLSMSENSCQLCAAEKLSFEPTPVYCTPCGRRVKRNVTHYTVVAGESRHYVCNSCFVARENIVSVDGTSVPKSRFEKKKNDEEVEEPWVQCDKCQAWQHQICALFNGRRNHGQTEYTCPNCYIREVEQGKRKPISQGVIPGAKSLPASTLSNHLEQRLFKKLKQERQERARLQGKSYEEVPGADSLVIRVVASVDKILEVKPHFLDIFREDNYSSQFPYKSKTILLFQKIEGVEVCLFGMYVQEFGTDSASPNQRRVYLSYLDSVKYFRPDVKTVTGEALRTFVYHEILIGYLDYCKKRGFSSCYIWACPPPKGEDYILYCHPEIQKTPKTVKLREWYLAMLKKASREKVVVECTNFYDHFFVQSGECKAKVTAARLPYFDGDYWPGAAEDIIDQMSEEEDSKKSNRKVTSKKVISKRALKAVRQSDLSVNASKDLLLMHKLGEMISPIKEDCIMVHLQHCCKHCCTLMVSGNRWVCTQCKNFQICDKCHEMEENRVEREKHPVNLKEKHVLYPIAIDDVPTEIKDDDDILESEFFDTRQGFLNLCQGNHYQYDTLRRAKHSSMMILYHLHNPSVPAFATTCAICQQELEIGQGRRCEVCPDFDVCNSCYSNGINHTHSLISRPSATESVAQNTQTSQIQFAKLRDLLLHVIQCRTTQCQYPKCPLLRNLFKHGVACKTQSKDCIYCTRLWGLMQMHARTCRDPQCKVPKCRELRAPLSRKQQQADSRRRAAVKEMVRQRDTDAEASTSE